MLKLIFYKLYKIFMIYLFSIIFLFLISLIDFFFNKQNSYNERNESIFSKKMDNNEPYWPTDFVQDRPHVYNFFIHNILTPLKIILWLVIAFLFILVRFFQKVLGCLITPIILIKYLYKYMHKKEIKKK